MGKVYRMTRTVTKQEKIIIKKLKKLVKIARRYGVSSPDYWASFLEGHLLLTLREFKQRCRGNYD